MARRAGPRTDRRRTSATSRRPEPGKAHSRARRGRHGSSTRRPSKRNRPQSTRVLAPPPPYLSFPGSFTSAVTSDITGTTRLASDDARTWPRAAGRTTRPPLETWVQPLPGRWTRHWPCSTMWKKSASSGSNRRAQGAESSLQHRTSPRRRRKLRPSERTSRASGSGGRDPPVLGSWSSRRGQRASMRIARATRGQEVRSATSDLRRDSRSRLPRGAADAIATQEGPRISRDLPSG